MTLGALVHLLHDMDLLVPHASYKGAIPKNNWSGQNVKITHAYNDPP